HFGLTTPNWTDGNFDGAATINLTDLSDVLNNFGVTNPSPSGATAGGNIVATPEPASLALLGLGAVGLLSRRRKA
ncbi:MAG: PEP-CTERM sorting domain-containing protein, partial [Phycisphaerae bacterium]